MRLLSAVSAFALAVTSTDDLVLGVSAAAIAALLVGTHDVGRALLLARGRR